MRAITDSASVGMLCVELHADLDGEVGYINVVSNVDGIDFMSIDHLTMLLGWEVTSDLLFDCQMKGYAESEVALSGAPRSAMSRRFRCSMIPALPRRDMVVCSLYHSSAEG